jgi:RND family efflux transporter MFP subunit
VLFRSEAALGAVGGQDLAEAQGASLQAQAAIATNEARIAQAQANITGAAAQTRQAQADVEAARAELAAAQERIGQAEAGVRETEAGVEIKRASVGKAASAEAAQRAQVRAAEAAAQTAKARIGAAGSGVREAAASLTEATVTRGYTEIRSLINGVVTRRLISPGVLVQPGQAILEIAQINPIRLQANVAESDLAKIEVGAPVTILDRDGDGKPLAARVTSIAPSVEPGARTGLVEAVVPNPDARFLPGEFVTMEITTGRVQNALRVPNRAIQYRATPDGAAVTTQTQPFVWIAKPAAGEAGQFTAERVDVKLGQSGGQYTSVLAGLEEGARVVVNGYQSLRDGTPVTAPAAAAQKKTAARSIPGAQTASVAITEKGYEPARLELKAGTPAKVTFTRQTEATCGTEIVIPEYSIRKKLPLDKPVTVEFTPKQNGEFKFTCGMDMLRGKVVVR